MSFTAGRHYMKKYLLISLMIAACSTTHTTSSHKGSEETLLINGKMFGAFYQQRAADYKALCFQAYNMARLRLDAYQPQTGKPKAIITDIDETILDNSPFAVHQGLQGKDYTLESWFEWTAKAAADTVPGAASFLKYAASKGVEVFYITNREERERKSTLDNLRKFGFPDTDDAHLFPRANSSSKEARRQAILATHEVILYIGDNLPDLSVLFDKKSETERSSIVQQLASDFGNRFILIPNFVYGDWEGTMYNYNYGIPIRVKDSIIRASLKGF
jgi:5'-nucleotidase (lipoprotein e(P4) family)